VHGTDEYRAAVETTLATSREVAAGIAASEHLRLVRPPELSVVLFERPGWTPEQYAEWSHRQALAGTILCVPTAWRGRAVLRLAFVNPDTDPDQVLEALETLR
jgi:glutamate/tyrosine decarboxylase-like PLP-dependent enzyme